jgi:glutamine transport system permease protein
MDGIARLMSQDYVSNWLSVLDGVPLLLRGLYVTVGVSACAFAAALAVGFLVALASISPARTLRWVAFSYVQIFRSISTYIYILWIYFALPIVLGIHLPAIGAAILALTCLHSAYLSETIRSAIKAVDSEQRVAGRALGLSGVSTLIYVVLPQATRVALPPVVNQAVHLIKDSALMAYIGVPDLMQATMKLAQFTNRSLEYYTSGALMYLTIVVAVSALAYVLERRQARWIE